MFLSHRKYGGAFLLPASLSNKASGQNMQRALDVKIFPIESRARYFTGVWGNTFEDRRFLISPGLATGCSPAQVQHRELSRAGSSCWRQSPFFRTHQPTAWRQEQTPPEWGTGYFKRFILSPTCASFGTSTEARQSLCRACTAGLINTRGHRNSFSQLRMFSGDEITHKMSIF